MYQLSKSSWPSKSKGRRLYGHNQLSASVSLLLLYPFSLIYSQTTTPNYTETTIYNIDGRSFYYNGKSRTYSDGLGRELQTQSLQGNDAIITGKTYDEAGRPVKTSMPFKQMNNPNLDYNSGDIIQQAIAAWPNGAGYDSAYSSVGYYADPLARAYATGSPGDSFVVSKHAAKSWTFGVTGSANPSADFDANGFILPSKLDTTTLKTTIPGDLNSYENSNPGSMKYFLSVSMDPNGNFSQVLKDQFGNTLRSASSADGANLIVSSMTYDLLGKVLSQTPPQTIGKEVDASTNLYNTAGEVLQKTTPDANTVVYRYNDYGQLTSMVDSNCQSANKIWDSVIYKYDEFGRAVLTAEMFGSDTGPRVRTVYDDTAGLRALLATCAGIPAEPDITTLLSSLTNIEGRVVAEIGYDEGLHYTMGTAEPEYARKVIKLYSYDEDGQVIAKYTSVPGMADLQKQFYTYDVHGKVLTVTHQMGGQTADIVYTYFYDSQGRLCTINKNGAVFVTYVYDDYGRLTQKTFTVGGVNYPVAYDYSIRGWIKKIDANSQQFVEQLCYEENELGAAAGFASQYNGNVSRVKTTNSTYLTTDMVYGYDKIDRLTTATNIQNPAADDYDATFSYLNDGRIDLKREGVAQAGWDNYAYNTGTNQLATILSSPKYRSSGNPNYIYDFNGNMVFDSSKKMTVEYDWRNMPVRFNIYDNIPSTVATWDDVKALASDPNVHRLHEIVMTYDAQGNRVKKEVVVPALDSCPDPNQSDGSFIITNDVTGTTYKFRNDGVLQTCKTITNDMSNPDADAFKWQVNEISQIAFNTDRLQISGALIENNATPESGNFQLYYEPESAPKFVDDQVTGNLEEAGQNTARSVSSGVAYFDGGRVFTYDQNSAKYALSYTASAEGVVRADGSVEVYVKDHLGSTRAVVYGTGQFKEAIAYFAYGAEQTLLTAPPDGRARMKFTGKEFDSDVGIGLTYFGARYYDPETGMWISTDSKGQFSSPYAYSGNPILMIDEDGNFFCLIPFLVGYIRHGIMNNDWKWQAVKSGLWTSAAFSLAINPQTGGAMAGMLMLNQGISNVAQNRAQGFFPNVGQFFMGAAEGYLDYANTATLGLANQPISHVSGTIRGYAYNTAQGITGDAAELNIKEARQMNKMFGSYLGQGSLVKAGSDWVWAYEGGKHSIGWNERYKYARAKRYYAEGGYSNTNSRFLDYIHGQGIKPGEIEMESWDQQNQGTWIPQFGHGFFGSFFSHQVWHEGFEEYGEPYEAFNEQDYSDDWGLWSWFKNYFVNGHDSNKTE